jgi:hypothetical protein
MKASKGSKDMTAPEGGLVALLVIQGRTHWLAIDWYPAKRFIRLAQVD